MRCRNSLLAGTVVGVGKVDCLALVGSMYYVCTYVCM